MTYKDDVVVTGTPVDDYMGLEARINRMEIVQVEDFRSFIDFPINKCLLTAEPDVAEQVEQELVALYGDSVTVFRSEPFFVEIMPKGVHKATSLEKLLEYLHMDVKNLVACGDGYNDLTIVKEHADYVTLSNDEDGLVPVIDKFILGE